MIITHPDEVTFEWQFALSNSFCWANSEPATCWWPWNRQKNFKAVQSPSFKYCAQLICFRYWKIESFSPFFSSSYTSSASGLLIFAWNPVRARSCNTFIPVSSVGCINLMPKLGHNNHYNSAKENGDIQRLFTSSKCSNWLILFVT
jgi:hypothetical protein